MSALRSRIWICETVSSVRGDRRGGRRRRILCDAADRDGHGRRRDGTSDGANIPGTEKQVARERTAARRSSIKASRQRASAARVAAAKWSGIHAEAARLGVLGPVPANGTEGRRQSLLALQRRVESLYRRVQGLDSARGDEFCRRSSAMLHLIAAHLGNPTAQRVPESELSRLNSSDMSVERTWPDVVGDLVLPLTDLWSIDIRVIVDANAPWTAHVDRVLDSTPFCVAWRVVSTVEAAESAREADWSR